MRMFMRYLESGRAFLSDKIGRCNNKLGCVSSNCKARKDDEALLSYRAVE